jgi:Zn-dependent protease
MKPGRNRLQLSVLKRLEAGLAPTRWQQLRLHMLAAWRRGRRLNIQRLWYHVKGVLRVLWMPWTLFRFRCVPVQIHSTFLIYPVGFFTWERYVEDAGAGVLWGIVFLLVYSSSLLVHEFAHVFTARHWGVASRCVLLIPLGAVAELDPAPGMPSEIWIALAGPLGSFTLAGVFWLALHGISPPGLFWFLEVRPLLRFGYALNLIVAVFNMLPCFPMDGGRVLRAGLVVIIGRAFPHHAGEALLIATRIAVRYVAWPVALGMMAWTIIGTRIWMHLVLFPLLVLCAEGEYWLLRTKKVPSGSDDL